MARKSAVKDYAADMDIQEKDVEQVIEELEVYISDSTKLEMQAGAAMIARAREEAELAQLAAELNG